jgi:hypothetical protein
MDATTAHVSLAQARLLKAITPEGLLFHFPRNLGTPELLNLALNCAASGQRIAIAHASPSAAHIASTLAQAAGFIELGQLPAPAALRAAHGDASLLYIACPLADANFFHVSIFDANGVALSDPELRRLVLENRLAQTRPTPCPRTHTHLRPSPARPCSVLIESPSHAVRRALLRDLAGQIEFTTPDCLLTSNPIRAMHQSAADWGAWIDAEGASLQLFNRDGAQMKVETVLNALATHTNCDPAQVLFHPTATRRAMALEMRRSQASLGADAHERIWFGADFPIADALAAVNLWACGASHCLRAPHAVPPALSRLAA